MTYSFGSISFGSLIVAFVQLLRQLCSVAMSEAGADGNIIVYIVFCLLRCLVGLLQWLIEYFNHYAYTEIALFGKKYLNAARDTWRLFKDRGIDALINDCLVDSVLSAGAVAIAFASMLVSYIYLVVTAPAYNADGSYTPVFLAFSFLIGLQVANIANVVLQSGVATFFVAMAEAPQAMAENNPALYARILQAYPRVAYSLHV
jgi:hypothetical protein